MSDKINVVSPIGRGRLGLIHYLERLPADDQLDAKVVLDQFCQTVEREVEQAYWDGHRHRRLIEVAKSIPDSQ